MAQFFEVHPDNPQQRLLKQAAALLARGEIVAVPTDSSYALACHLDDKDAVAALRGGGVDPGVLRGSLVRYLDTALKELVVVEGEVQPAPTRGFQRMMQRADAEATEAGQSEVTGAHCIIGLLDEWKSPAAQLLAEQNMTRQAALDFIASGAGRSH